MYNDGMMDEHRLALSIYGRRFNLIIKAIHQSLKIAVPKKESVNRNTHTHRIVLLRSITYDEICIE